MTQLCKKILYVDDDSDDREIFYEAIKGHAPEADVVFAENGLQALDYLNETLTHHSDLPCLIVLDINMPYLDGKETFHRIKKDNRLQDVPVVIFTSSEKPSDKDLFIQLGTEFITKPNDYKYMHQIADHMLAFCP